MKALLILVAVLISTPGFAWDPIGDITSGKVFRNIPREAGRIVDQGRKDLRNGLDRIDPRITQFGRDLDRMRLELQSSVFTGPALEQWFYASRNSAMKGAMPVPPHVRQALLGWFDPAVIDSARYKVGDGGALNLANNSIRVGGANAVALIDVIVFRGPTEAENLALWAHEMKHVEQFRDWGVRNFSIRYMRSWNSVENPAYEIERQYAARNGEPPQYGGAPQGSGGQFGRNVPQPAPQIVQPDPQVRPGYGQPQFATARMCVVGPGPFARCPLQQPLPQRANCSCLNQYGQVFYGMSQ